MLDLAEALDEEAAKVFEMVAFLADSGPEATLFEGGVVEILAAAAGGEQRDRGVQ